MVRLFPHSVRRAGLPPGTVTTPEQEQAPASVSIISYDETNLVDRAAETIAECVVLKTSPGVTWINVDGLRDTPVLQQLAEGYGLHPLVQEDIVHTEQRPKVDDYGDYLYVTARMLYANDTKTGVVSEQVSLVLGPNFVLSFQEQRGDVFEPIRERIRTNKGRVRKMGADYLAYCLLDAIVDSYFVILEQLGDVLDEIEERVMQAPSSRVLARMHRMKRELVFLRRSVSPLRDLFGSLLKTESPLVTKATQVYLKDVYDHSVQIVEAIDTYRDILSGLMDVYLSSLSNRANEVMKLLTVIATIFIPLTFIVGVYGMNFKYMPELEWRLGYALCWLVMLIVAGAMIVWFRRRKWI